MYKIEAIKVAMIVNGKKVKYNVDLDLNVECYEFLRDDLNDLFMEVTSELDSQIYYDVPKASISLEDDYYE